MIKEPRSLGDCLLPQASLVRLEASKTMASPRMELEAFRRRLLKVKVLICAAAHACDSFPFLQCQKARAQVPGLKIKKNRNYVVRYYRVKRFPVCVSALLPLFTVNFFFVAAIVPLRHTQATVTLRWKKKTEIIVMSCTTGGRLQMCAAQLTRFKLPTLHSTCRRLRAK